MAIIAPQAKFREVDANGDPLAGGKLYTYVAGTTTPQTTYTDAGGLTPNTNPVVLDSSGRADVWLGNAKYKFVLKDANDVTIYTEDNIDGTGSGGNNTAAWVTHSVTDGQAAADLAGETVDSASYKSAIYSGEISRGTTVFSNVTFVLQYINSAWRIVMGDSVANEANGVTFSITSAGGIAQVQAALDSGAGDGTIKLSRTLVPA